MGLRFAPSVRFALSAAGHKFWQTSLNQKTLELLSQKKLKLSKNPQNFHFLNQFWTPLFLDNSRRFVPTTFSAQPQLYFHLTPLGSAARLEASGQKNGGGWLDPPLQGAPRLKKFRDAVVMTWVGRVRMGGSWPDPVLLQSYSPEDFTQFLDVSNIFLGSNPPPQSWPFRAYPHRSGWVAPAAKKMLKNSELNRQVRADVSLLVSSFHSPTHPVAATLCLPQGEFPRTRAYHTAITDTQGWRGRSHPGFVSPLDLRGRRR